MATPHGNPSWRALQRQHGTGLGRRPGESRARRPRLGSWCPGRASKPQPGYWPAGASRRTPNWPGPSAAATTRRSRWRTAAAAGCCGSARTCRRSRPAPSTGCSAGCARPGCRSEFPNRSPRWAETRSPRRRPGPPRCAGGFPGCGPSWPPIRLWSGSAGRSGCSAGRCARWRGPMPRRTGAAIRCERTPTPPGPASWPGRCAPRACPRPRSGDWRRPPSRSAPRRKRQRLTCRSRSCTATWAPRTRSWTSAPARCPGCSTSSWPGRTRGCRTCRSRCCSPARWPGPAGPAAPPPWSAGTPRS